MIILLWHTFCVMFWWKINFLLDENNEKNYLISTQPGTRLQISTHPQGPKIKLAPREPINWILYLTNVWCDICIHIACTVKNAKKNTVQKKLNIVTGSVYWHQTGHSWHRSQCLAAVWISFLDYLPQALRGLIL